MRKAKIETLKSIIYSLKVMRVEEIEKAKDEIKKEQSFHKWQKTIFVLWCDLSILVKQRREKWQKGNMSPG